MPLLATFIGSIATSLVTFFAQFMSYRLALKLAAYVTWAGIASAFVASTYICVSSLYLAASSLFSGGGGGGGWMSYFGMAVGMFIPGNAGAVMSCIGSVWIATSVYKFQKDAIIHFGS